MFNLPLPYSGKLSREKTFAFFAVSEPSVKVFSAKFCGRRYSLGVWPCCAHEQLSISYRFPRGGRTVDMWELLSKEKLGEIDVLVV